MMAETPPGASPDPGDILLARSELQMLQGQADAERAVLERLRGEVAAAASELDDARAASLLEANERLMLAVVQAQEDLDTSAERMDEISRRSGIDALTGLPGRALFDARFEQAILAANVLGQNVALLFLDIDNFKHINDTLGHAIGDEVLRFIAQRINIAIRDTDLASRYGGDEFVILLDGIDEHAEGIRIAEKVIATLAVPTQLEDHVLRLAASIGISIYPRDGADVASLIRAADIAMYRAKRELTGCASFSVEAQAADRIRQWPALALPLSPLTRYDQALVEHEERHAQLMDANQNLIIAALGAQQLQAAAVSAQRQQKEFLAMMAHELRNPLASIQLAASMLDTGSARDPDKMVSIIEREVTRMARLISDLLDVSRISTGKLRLENRMLDMSALIIDAVAASRPAMDARLQHFIVEAPVHAMPVYGDALRLTQVLGNLLDNASKYTPRGGEIFLDVIVVDDVIVISFTDNGIGISAEALPHVFDPFRQDVQAIGFNGTGLGIGLTVVRELIEAHGGSVAAHSAGEGLGSRFTVSLPLSSGSLDAA